MKFKHILICILLLVALFFLSKNSVPKKIPKAIPTLTPIPTPTISKSYIVPTIGKKPVYGIAMIGDSMTAALGPHGGGLSDHMNSLYKENAEDPQRIIIDNYATSSSILAVNTQLTQKVTIDPYTLGPLLSQNYDLILVESFGYNPLSQFGLEEGLRQQSLALEGLMKKLISTFPRAAIVFVATIAPNKQNYAKMTQPNYSAEERAKGAEERISYIKNHIQYATDNNIPLINIYEKSLTENEDGNVMYVNPTDDIHPSFAGVDFIGHEIGNFIHDSKILPK
ncbi:hypothetical protein A3G67_02215 [Candidatus Roizmanbacteria bacterium RIFCSPLOWO2_12_FULL_40_12]|uniref:SGNH hydrolase-type esterase domain-containing protein n=1 Tax=Candidatus Roizmanbacteria bacterium RIFCSPLOWO2_01_FULL_40_42 TaxID=1802066 RepID=A0A1F7J3T5_9BACT|nr:MAG: hypothetical protein A2779_01420 [Candidatus Roizmanbacteria bacterium RIFCSPHIGHO2_01_FULL_40_98]OGK29019.1 MAG: hypothetical protein A3C31_02060 [Candidatus Roizmanbacteria bacterium RIFCSPHIGHO2_02_FULL_40_53]OGK29984.1 MAG: hypothetical protein A2W49_00150 [Candidatus Roizmanbacteria bacterium RIFCSPHIGHO2_12_41_18]OGK37307.1 MAG: hypothetical protein A3E69_04360 [Candidatus Roizmanbacteria bacterium RIFCSPHIGHO2_12_FULL_40_130]OGK50249.1 MAG: hypothetical protein A3B50_00515 [Candi